MSVQEQKLKAIADAIREKDGTVDPIPARDFPDRIRAIPGGGDVELISIEITSPPNKTSYYAGESFDATGMIISGYYQNGEVSLSGVVTGYTISPSGALAAGTNKVIITYAEGRIVKTCEQPISVVKRSVAVPIQSGSLTYNGQPQAPVWTGYDSGIMTKTETPRTDAGSSSTVFALKDPDLYRWSDGTITVKMVGWSIGQAANSVTCDPASLVLTSDAPSNSFRVNRLGSGAISASSSDTSKATVSVSGETVTVTGVNSGSVKITVNVATDTNYLAGTAEVSVSLDLYPDFNELTPAQISELSANGQISSLYAVGDETAEIDMNGKVSDGLTLKNFKIRAFIVGIDHNQEVESPNKHRVHLQLGKVGGKLVGFCDSGYKLAKTSGQWFTMYNVKSNSGGWKSSLMRKNIMGGDTLPTSPKANSLLAALPAAWRAVMKSVTKYTDNTGGGSERGEYVTASTEYFCPAAAAEYFWSGTYANGAERYYQLQYAYYKAGNSRIHYRHNETGDDVNAWTRSVHAERNTSFIVASYDGTDANGLANYSHAVSPLFFV